jgi:hypothetical protein
MKRLIIFIFLTILCLISKAQIVKDEKTQRVSEPLKVYREWRIFMLECDSTKKDMQDDLDSKDSINAALKKERDGYKAIVAIKDSTNKVLISDNEKLAVTAKKDKSFSSPVTYIVGMVCLVLGIALGK